MILLVLLYATTETVMGSTEAEKFFKSCNFKPSLSYGSKSFEAYTGNIMTKYKNYKMRVDLNNQIVTLTGSLQPYYDFKYIKFDFKNHKLSFRKVQETCKCTRTAGKEETKDLAKDLVLPPSFPPEDSIPCGNRSSIGILHFFYSKKYDIWYNIHKIRHRDGHTFCEVEDINFPGQMKTKPTCDKPTQKCYAPSYRYP